MTDSEIVELFFDRNEQAINETVAKYKSYCNSIAFGFYSSVMPESNSNGAFSINKDRVHLKIGNILRESTEWSYKELENSVDNGIYGIGSIYKINP